MASVTVRNLIKDSLMEIGVLAGGESLSAEDGEFGTGRLNQIFDNYNAMREASFVMRFDSFTLTPSQQDYTLGPAANSPDFLYADARPASIDAANVILTNVSPSVKNPIAIRDWQWWAGVSVAAITSTFPTDLYYEATWPLGIVHFWPEPTSAFDVELITSRDFAQVVVTDTINLPSGYQNALMLTLAEDCWNTYKGNQPMPALLVTKAREARGRIFTINTFVPRLVTQDSGMPSNSRNRCDWNYRTGLPMSRS